LHERKLLVCLWGFEKLFKRHITANRKYLGSNYQNFRHQTLAIFESRLDVVLYRASFSLSIKVLGK
jgi:ribosomal protein S4